MKKITLLVIMGLIITSNSWSQQFVQSRKVYSRSTGYKFNNEWQYVSSDMYLFNSQKFNYLINNINPGQKKKKHNKDVIKNLLVTAQLDGLGDLDKLVYPIFNFVVTSDAKGNLNAQVTEPEAIRLVDNIPISTVKDYIGAKIQIQVYTSANKPEIYKFLADQLQIAATFTTASVTDAALKVVGEIGKMMQQDAAGKQYQFSSTIRFYQDRNFDRRFHSITIFTFEPSYLTRTSFDSSSLSRFFDTTKTIVFDKELLKKIINYTNFPFIVVVNYRSKYRTKIADDVDFDLLNARDATNDANYRTNVISKDVYLQEKSLINYLRAYTQLQLDINNYVLNYQAKITEDYKIQLFIILQDYRKMKNYYKITQNEFSNNPLFINEFKPYYERYLTKACLKFEENSSLRNIEDVVDAIYSLDNYGIAELDSIKREDYLRKLKSVKIPPREINSDEAQIINRWISLLETDQYLKVFKPKIDYLSSLPVETNTFYKITQLKMNSSNSFCDICKDNVNSFVNSFTPKYEQYLYTLQSSNYTNLKNKAKFCVIDYSKRISFIESNLDSNYSASNNLYGQLIIKTLQNIKENNNKLIEMIGESKTFATTDEIANETNNIQNIINSIEYDFSSICKNDPKLCQNQNTQQGVENNNQ